MYKGLIPAIVSLLLILPTTAAAQSVYKIVNPDGSVTYTDQKPSPDAQPVELRPLSVIETDISAPEPAEAGLKPGAAGEAEQETEPSRAELRRMYRDFRISQPLDEETFWGTGNQVAVSWDTATPLRDGMRVTVYVNGEGQDATGSPTTFLTLDRGQHNVYAILWSGSNQRIAATPQVTFFVKQHSVNFNRRGGGP